MLRAITDNLVHGSLAVIIWLLGYMSHVECCQGDERSRHLGNGLARHTVVILQSVVCGVVSCAVDADHFLAAGSFDLEVSLFVHKLKPGNRTTRELTLLCYCQLHELIVVICAVKNQFKHP